MKELIYKIRIEGTQKQAAELAKLTSSLKQVTSEQAKLIAKETAYKDLQAKMSAENKKANSIYQENSKQIKNYNTNISKTKNSIVQVNVQLQNESSKLEKVKQEFKQGKITEQEYNNTIKQTQQVTNKLTSQLSTLNGKLDTQQKQLKQVTAEGQKTYAQKLKELKLTDQERQKLTQLTVTQSKLRNEKAKLNLGIKQSINLNKSETNTLGRINALLAEEKVKMQGIAIGSKAFKTAANNIKYLETQQRKANAAMGRGKTFVGEYAQGAKAAFMKIGAAVTGALILWRSLNRVVGGNIATFKEWQTGQTNVQTLLDKTDETLESRTIELVKKHGLAIADTNKALFDSVSAGVAVADSTAFLDEVTQLAIGGVTDLTTATDGVTSVMNAYGLSMEETGEVTAAFFSAQKFGKTTVAELSQEIGQTAPIAKIAGVGYKELLSTYAELTKQGVKTNLATTAIKSTITALIKPSAEAKKKFKELGIEVGINAIKNNGLMNTLVKVGQAVEKDGDALTELIPNVRALTGVGALGTEAMEDYHNILEVVQNDYGEGSSLAKAYEMQMDTLAKRVDVFKAGLRATGIEFARRLQPILIKSMDALQGVGKWIKENSTILTTLIKVVGLAGAAFVVWKVAVLAYNKAALLGNKIQAAATAIQKAYQFVMAKAKGNLAAATIAQKGLNTAMKANPAGLMIAAVTALVGALVLFSKSVKGANHEMAINNELFEATNEQMIQEEMNLNKRFDALNDANITDEQRKKLITEINTQYGEYLPYLLTEKSSIEDINTAREIANESIKETIQLRAIEEVLVKKAAEYEEELADLATGKKDGFWDFAKSLIGVNFEMSTSVKELSKINDQIEYLEERKAGVEFTKQLRVMQNEALGLTKQLENIPDKTSKVAVEIQEKIALIEAQIKLNIEKKELEDQLEKIKDKTSDAAIDIQDKISNLKLDIKTNVELQADIKPNIIPLTSEQIAEVQKQTDDLLNLKLQGYQETTTKSIISEERRLKTTVENYTKEVTNVELRNKLIEEAQKQHEVRLTETLLKSDYKKQYTKRLTEEQTAFETTILGFQGTAAEKERLYMEHYDNIDMIVQDAELDKTIEKIYDSELKKVQDVLDKELQANEESWILKKATLEEGSAEYLAAYQEYLDKKAAMEEAAAFAEIAAETEEAIKEDIEEGKDTPDANIYDADVNNLDMSLKQKKALLKQYYETGLISEEIYQKRLIDLQNSSNKNRVASLQALSQTMENVKGMVNEQSAAFKALSVAQAVISTYLAATQVLANPMELSPLAKILSMVAVISTGLAQVAQIKKQKIPQYSTGGIIYGHGTPTSDNIPIMASPEEAIINAKTMQSNEIMSVTGTPRQIASEINALKGYGKRFAAGGIVPGISRNSTTINNEPFDRSIITDIVAETVEGVTNIPVTLVSEHVTKAQRLTEVAENQGNL